MKETQSIFDSRNTRQILQRKYSEMQDHILEIELKLCKWDKENSKAHSWVFAQARLLLEIELIENELKNRKNPTKKVYNFRIFSFDINITKI